MRQQKIGKYPHIINIIKHTLKISIPLHKIEEEPTQTSVGTVVAGNTPWYKNQKEVSVCETRRVSLLPPHQQP